MINEEGTLKEIQSAERVYFDSVNGVAGTVWPIGTAAHPVSNWANAVTIAAARNTDTIVLVHGVITLDANIAGYRFIGNGFSDPNEDEAENWIDLAGFTATECSFEYINIDFDAAGTLIKCGHFLGCSNIWPDTMVSCSYFFNCGYIHVATMTDCEFFYNCVYLSCGAITTCNYFSNCGYIETTIMVDCYYFHNCGEASIIYDCTGLGSDPIMSFRTGTITITKLTDAYTFTITGDGLRLTIEATCNAGTIDVYGNVKIAVAPAATTIVNDYTLNRYGDRVYYDDTLGVAGTDWPIGTAPHPCGVLADIRTICTRENIHTIVVRGTLTLDATMDSYDFIGGGSFTDMVDINGKSTNNSVFRGLDISGAMTSIGEFYNCFLSIVTGARCEAFDCVISSVVCGAPSLFFNCKAWSSATIDAGGFDLFIIGWEGGLTISGVTVGGEAINIFAQNSSPIIIDTSCTAGAIYLDGDYSLTDNSAGAAVYDLGIRSKMASYAKVPVTVASANLKNSNDAEKTTIALAYTRIKEIIIGAELADVRINFDLKTAGGGATATARIYQNGAAVGAVQTDVTGGYVTKTEDLTGLVAGDKIQIYAFTSSALQAAYVQNFRLLYDITDTLVATNNDP